MKLCFAINDAPKYVGGSQVNMRRLLPRLKQRGHDVHALILHNSTEPTNGLFLEQNGVLTHFMQRPLLIKDASVKIAKKIRKIKPDVFIADHSISSLMSAAYFKGEIPTIGMIRGGNGFNMSILKQFGNPTSPYFIDGMGGVSQFICQKIESESKGSIIKQHIPSGVIVPEKIAHHENEGLNFIYLGRLTQDPKKVIEMLKGFVPIMHEKKHVKFYIVGNGPEENNLKKIAEEAGLTDRVIFPGVLLKENFYELLQKMNSVVLLSESEGTPGAIMDGMAAGLVPISLKIDGIDELVVDGQTGILVTNRESDLVKAVDKLEDRSYLIQLAKNARKHINDHYTIDKTVDKWEAFVDQVANSFDKSKKRFNPSTKDIDPYLVSLEQKSDAFGDILKQKFNNLKWEIKFRIKRLKK